MPRIIIGDSLPKADRRRSLVDRLAHELVTPGDGPQPMVIERRISRPRFRHVWVVWDEWSDCTEGERAEIIVEAYEQVEGVNASDDISVALGILAREAATFGALPYLVQPIHSHLMERSDYRQALAQEARHTVMGETAKLLRYPTEEEANKAIERLRESSPQTSWAIHQDIAEED